MPDVVGRLRMPRLDAAPASPRMGEMFFHQIKRVVCFWDGTVWVDIINLSPVPYARMNWAGTVGIPGSAHCSCGTGTADTTGVAVTLTAQFHSGDTTQMDLTKGRLIARRKGLYTLNAAVAFEAHADDRARGCAIRANQDPIGGIVAATVPSIGAGLDTVVAITGLWVMNPGDYAEITFYQGTGATLNIKAIRFSFAFMSPAAP
jgi:hypothetical protein